ncbi:MAG: hypothetical protein ACUVRY_08340 [Thermoanaerobaculaceae bacterium]
MSRLWPPLVAVLPGIGIAILALFGWVPTARDIPSYFVPLRVRTAEVLRGEASPWLNPNVGCGEPFFANPQSALLYPPAWWSLLLAPPKALGVEVGCHFALLGAGLFFLCRRLGGRPVQALAASWGGQFSGPVLSAAGMVNNLETAAWLPWIWWATLTERPRLLASFVALGFFAAEPTLALGGAAVALGLAPNRRTLKGLALGLGLAAVQLVPMAYWIAQGDRGPGKPLEAMSAGGLSLPELPALVIAGFPLPTVDVRFLPVITLPAWVFVGLIGLRLGEQRQRRLFLASLVFLGLAVLPTLPWGDSLWAALTFGFVRLPGRFLLPASLGFLALAGGVSWPHKKRWLALAVAIGLAGLGFSQRPALHLAQAASAAVTPWLPAAALAASGVLFLGTGEVLSLALWQPRAVPCRKALGEARVFTLPVNRSQLQWARDHAPEGTLQLAWGYSVLLDGRSVVRTHGPLQNSKLALHLREADRGAEASWWVSAAGASRILALNPLPGFPVLCRERDLWVLANPAAFPLWGLVQKLPDPGAFPVFVGETLLRERRASLWRFSLRAREDGIFLWLFSPDPGWFFRLDGRLVKPVRGVGILQGVEVKAGEHQLEVGYRPAGLRLGLALSFCSFLGLLWRSWW